MRRPGSRARPGPRWPSGAAPPGPVAAPPDQPLLLPIVNEFNRMQQQMLDQFHQTMLMMAEMFSNLHREQASLVREELDEMRRLTRELHALQEERARQPMAQVGLQEQAADANAMSSAEGEAVDVEKKPAGAARNGPAAPEQGNKTRGSAGASPEVHDWLSRRIERLQEERNDRWQKILQFITGGKNP